MEDRNPRPRGRPPKIKDEAKRIARRKELDKLAKQRQRTRDRNSLLVGPELETAPASLSEPVQFIQEDPGPKIAYTQQSTSRHLYFYIPIL